MRIAINCWILQDFVPKSNSPTFLYGYGGFGIDVLPYYEPAYGVFVQNFAGVFAVANIRGGGWVSYYNKCCKSTDWNDRLKLFSEYGKNWHTNGRVLNKQNSFDDFQAAAQYLYDQKYTSPPKLFINGGSNGGYLKF